MYLINSIRKIKQVKTEISYLISCVQTWFVSGLGFSLLWNVSTPVWLFRPVCTIVVVTLTGLDLKFPISVHFNLIKSFLSRAKVAVIIPGFKGVFNYFEPSIVRELKSWKLQTSIRASNDLCLTFESSNSLLLTLIAW